MVQSSESSNKMVRAFKESLREITHVENSLSVAKAVDGEYLYPLSENRRFSRAVP